MINLLIATGNSHKVSEIKSILGPIRWLNICYLDGQKYTVEIDECGTDYYENARIKADGYYDYLNGKTGLKNKFKPDYIAGEDSGLEVECLGGRPGLYTARFAGINATSSENIRKLLSEMKSEGGCLSDRTARFVCYVCLRDVKNDKYFYFSGETKGRITQDVEGENGFGYDPVFFVPEFNRTAAQLTMQEKNKISHRGFAFNKVLAKIKDLKNISDGTNAS